MASKKRSAKSATEGLKILWEDGFFRTWKKMEAVVGEFADRDNHFSNPELGMALKRAAHLVRRGKTGSFEYIQKYPFERAEARKPKKEKKNEK